MKIQPTLLAAVVIDGAPSLDPITVVFRDETPGRGGVLVECYGKAWSANWGAMGDVKVRDFVRTVSPEYLANKLKRDGEKQTKAVEAYLLRIATAVIKALSV